MPISFECGCEATGEHRTCKVKMVRLDAAQKSMWIETSDGREFLMYLKLEDLDRIAEEIASFLRSTPHG